MKKINFFTLVDFKRKVKLNNVVVTKTKRHKEFFLETSFFNFCVSKSSNVLMKVRKIRCIDRKRRVEGASKTIGLTESLGEVKVFIIMLKN